MHLTILLAALFNAFLASAVPAGDCTSTLHEKITCNHGGITATRYGSAVVTSTAAVNCHGCHHLSITRSAGICAVSQPYSHTSPRSYGEERTSLLWAFADDSLALQEVVERPLNKKRYIIAPQTEVFVPTSTEWTTVCGHPPPPTETPIINP
ncbi:hypothetical protein MMC21_007748 [Puttea exsequens]|nr:hypothetical protein [Puttea exsequens]